MKNLLEKFLHHPQLKNFTESIEKNNETILAGAVASAKSFFSAAAYEKTSKPFLFIFDDEENAAYFYNDLQAILQSSDIYFFPSSTKKLSHNSGLKIDKASIMMRTETLLNIKNKSKHIIVSYPEAIAETVIAPENIQKDIISIATGDSVDPEFLAEMLKEYDFVKTDFVYEPGQFSIRGGIVDVFSFSCDYPYRIDFFGDEIESIRTFDIDTQLSIKKIDKIKIVKNYTFKEDNNRIPFFDFLQKNTIIFFQDFNFVKEKIKDDFDLSENINVFNPETDKTEVIEIISQEIFCDKINKFKKVKFSSTEQDKNNIVKLNISPQPAFGKNFNLLAEELFRRQSAGFQTFILSNSEKQLERLQDILQSNEVSTNVNFIPQKGYIHKGFSDNDLLLTIFTDHQIFNRFQAYKLKNYATTKAKETQLLSRIKDLHPGDYVVHIDYGIGIFKGLTTIENNGKKQEVVSISYQDNDNLYVSIHALHKISKYKSSDGEPPKINKLGSNYWKTKKAKAKSKIKDIAKDLIELYAKRLQEKGFAFSHDTYLQEALEASFIYEETPDQLKAIAEVKADMEDNKPMDRLVCGDVGFGKTEIAIRAAFKAVADNKQVALLCPTTILAYQHYRTFSDRLKDLPVTIDYLSRMRTTKEQKEIIEKLKNGQIDIIIGTHRLVSKDIKFKDLGLLIIDEEQKFGVSVKEKLKQLRVNVDTLTLTATPIPRTLQFSLMGARDLSILQTPPPNRQPIITELHTFNDTIIRKAIEFEINRGGQIFFVHNHIDTLPKIKDFLNKIIPEATVKCVHGRMKPTETEKIITEFIKGNFDVLLTTSIIENGLDIPNANTIIINNAQKFGLSDLHQLRGRVGRSYRKAFCYLIAPPKTALKPNARKRLEALENFVELGSGFNIALQDLDIRGAGDLLGAQQSGFINDFGYETYKQILEEAMLELKTNEYKHIFAEKQNSQTFVTDCQISTDLDIGLPENYVPNNAERLKLYKKLDSIKNPEDLQTFENEIIDRFGQMPQQTKELLNLVKVRFLAISLGIEKIVLKQNLMLCYPVSDPNSSYYDSDLFKIKILNKISEIKNAEMKIKNNKLYFKFVNVKNFSEALKILARFSE